jgi:arylsulfatase A-like enzyme
MSLPRATLGESDASDKPPYVRRRATLSGAVIARITDDFQARRESLLAVDEAVARIVGALEAAGRLDDTYVLFTSDNGFFQGEHNIAKGKYLAYEPSTHVPLLVRGPGIPAGTVSGELISNADLAPTILEVTGSRADRTVDGRSLMPFARDGALRTGRPVLHEGLVGGDLDRDAARRAQASGRAGVYYGVRTQRYLYVRWRGGARELYDLAVDPRELVNVARNPRYAAVRSLLGADLTRLRRCAGAVCNEPQPRSSAGGDVPKSVPVRSRARTTT